MACIGSDGKPTVSGIKVLRVLDSGANNPEDIAHGSGLPLFRVRSGLRQMVDVGLVSKNSDMYTITMNGKSLI